MKQFDHKRAIRSENFFYERADGFGQFEKIRFVEITYPRYIGGDIRNNKINRPFPECITQAREDRRIPCIALNKLDPFKWFHRQQVHGHDFAIATNSRRGDLAPAARTRAEIDNRRSPSQKSVAGENFFKLECGTRAQTSGFALFDIRIGRLPADPLLRFRASRGHPVAFGPVTSDVTYVDDFVDDFTTGGLHRDLITGLLAD